MKDVGDRAGEGGAYGNLGSSYHSLGGYSKAIEYHAKHLAIAKEVDNRAKEVQAYGNFGTVHFYLIEYVKDLAYQKERHALYTTDLRAFLQP